MRQQREAVIGRDSAVHDVVEALRATGDSARVLLITAQTGMGKTAVVEQARQVAADDGATVLRLGWEGTGDPDDATVVEVGCRLVVEDPDGCLPSVSAQRRALSHAAVREGEVSALSAFSELLTEASRQTPFALVVDGIEQMPQHSAATLALLLRVFRPRGVPVVMAGRPWPAADLGGHQLRAAADWVLELPPLRPVDIAALVNVHMVRRFGRPAEPELADAVSRALGPLAGNPRAVLSVLDALDEQDLVELDGLMCLTLLEKRLRMTTGPAALLPLDWPGSPPYSGIVEAAIVTALVLDHAEVHVDDAFRMTSSADARAIEQALDRLIMDRILTADPQGRLSFAVPALAAALRTLPIQRDVQGNSARYVMRLTDEIGAEAVGRGYPRLADRVAAAGQRLDDDLAVPLLLAAAREEARTNWRRSARAYAAALHRLTPQDERTPGALHEASSLSLRHGDHAGLLALGEPLFALDAPHTEHTEDVAAAWAWAALHEHRSPHTDRFPAAAGPPTALGGLYGIGPIAPRATTSDRHVPDTEPGDHPTQVPSPAELHLIAAAVGSHAELLWARHRMPADAIDNESLDRLRQAAAYADLAGACAAVLGDRYTADPDGIAAQYHEMVRNYLTGNWDTALAAARRIEIRSRTHPAVGFPHLPRALAAEIHAARGNITHARAWLDLIPDAPTHPLTARARLALRYQSGHTQEAFEGAGHDARQARKNGQLAGVERLLLRALSLAALHDRHHKTVRQALEELETLHDESAATMTHEALLLARGIAYHDRDSALTAHHLINGRGDVHLSITSSICLADIGDDPRSRLAEALRHAHRLSLGGPFRAAITRVAQRRNIPVPRLRQAHETLTESDIALVRMVSDGATNRQIAAELACSPKTVEQRLTRLFQRTGTRSRTELTATWLNGTLPQPHTA